ncbi:MAG: transposase [Trichodesmium sp. St16_bin2-tuft]|nr:transposase [Trichodesmium sp. St16_bin2-tuft]MDE5111552.1 transposase [Trichodesmium sp. St7_bin2_1]
MPKTDNSVGIDLGIKTKASCRGALIQPPYTVKKLMQENHQRNECSKYPKLSKSLSKKTKGFKGYEKARLKMTKFHGKLKDTRRDFLHKLSTEISVKTKQLFYKYDKFLE